MIASNIPSEMGRLDQGLDRGAKPLKPSTASRRVAPLAQQRRDGDLETSPSISPTGFGAADQPSQSYSLVLPSSALVVPSSAVSTPSGSSLSQPRSQKSRKWSEGDATTFQLRTIGSRATLAGSSGARHQVPQIFAKVVEQGRREGWIVDLI